jgi:hypothetical protein
VNRKLVAVCLLSDIVGTRWPGLLDALVPRTLSQ